MLLENELIPIVVHMIGVLPGAGACLPEVSEFWQMLRRLSLGALSGTFVQEGRLEGKNPVYVSGLLSFSLACSCWGWLSVLWEGSVPETHSSFPPGHCLLLGWESHSALGAF